MQPHGLCTVCVFMHACVRRHQSEVSRLRGELEAAQRRAAADTAAVRQEAAEQVAAAEARARK